MADGSKASGVTGGTPARAARSGVPKPPPAWLRSLCAESEAVSSWPRCWKGSREAIQAVGRPTASTTSRGTPGDICSPHRFTAPPANSTSSAQVTPIATKASRTRKRGVCLGSGTRPAWSCLGTVGISVCALEPEVDERWHPLAGHGGAHEDHHRGQPGTHEDRRKALETLAQPVGRALG